MHREGRVDVGLATTSASESLKGSKLLPASGKQFDERISTLGWDDLSLVRTPMVWEFTYWHLCCWAGEEVMSLREPLWLLIAKKSVPRSIKAFRQSRGIPESTAISAPEFAPYRNSWCDVHTALAHIKAKRDHFITCNPKDFRRNPDRLAELGLTSVLTPDEFVALDRTTANRTSKHP